MNTAVVSGVSGVTWWRDTVAPKEHGSWSLAFEPLALGILVAPSVPGTFLTMALGALFFARRPLRLAMREHRAERRTAALRALLACAGIALVAITAAVVDAGAAWMVWLTPMLLCGGVFAFFDAQGAGREEPAEIAGAATFAWAPAVLAILAGWSAAAALGLGLVMLGRSIPTVMYVRAYLRAAKTGVEHVVGPVVAACSAILVTAMLVSAHRAPAVALGFVSLLAVRAVALLCGGLVPLRARTVGMMEAVVGVVFVITLAIGW